MKCDELKVRTAYSIAMEEEDLESSGTTLVYLKSDVDSAFAEIKSKLESVQASMYCDVVDSNMENRRLKRALWLARAERAHAEWGHWATIWFCDTNVELNINKSSVSQEPYRCTTKRNAAIWRNIWHDVERKCRAKAKEYK